MARIKYKEGYGPLSGVYAGVEYKVLSDGRCCANMQRLPTPKEVEKSPAARAEFIIKTCVKDIQIAMHNQREAMKQYTNITHRVRRLYEKCYALEKDDEKLQKMIMTAYWQSRRVLPSRRRGMNQLSLDVVSI